jgi:hypothetical protein
MKTRTITLSGDFPEGTGISGPLLMDVLALLVHGTKMALRLRVEGRSKAQGSDPGWLQKAAYFEFAQIREGSRAIDFQAPPLSETVDEWPFSFALADPHLPATDLLTQSLDAALQGDLESAPVDAAFLKTITPLIRRILSAKGVQQVELDGGDRQPLRLDAKSIDTLERVENTIPAAHTIRLSGRLVRLDVETGAFEISQISHETETPPHRVRGWLDRSGVRAFTPLLGQPITINAEAHYAAQASHSNPKRQRIKLLNNAILASPNEAQASIIDSIQCLRLLQAGWQGQGQGQPYDPTWLDQIEALALSLHKDLGVAPPYIYGTPNDEVQFEWDLQRSGEQWGVEALFKRDTRTIELFAVQTNAHPNEHGDHPHKEAQAFLDRPEAAAHMATFIKQFEEP